MEVPYPLEMQIGSHASSFSLLKRWKHKWVRLRVLVFLFFFHTKGNNLRDFLFASLEDEVLPLGGLRLRKEFAPGGANSHP